MDINYVAKNEGTLVNISIERIEYLVRLVEKSFYRDDENDKSVVFGANMLLDFIKKDMAEGEQ